MAVQQQVEEGGSLGWWWGGSIEEGSFTKIGEEEMANQDQWAATETSTDFIYTWGGEGEGEGFI